MDTGLQITFSMIFVAAVVVLFCFILVRAEAHWFVLPTFMVALLFSRPSGNTLTDMTRMCLLGDPKSNRETAQEWPS